MSATISLACSSKPLSLQDALYIIECGANILGNSGVHTLGDNSAFVNPAGQLLLTRRGKTSMDGVGIVFAFYSGPLLETVGKIRSLSLL